jgi:hypothetical protein
MKTVTLSAYHPWGSSAYCLDLYYRHDVIKAFEGHHYDTLYKMAKAWALINGFTHYRQGGVKGKL